MASNPETALGGEIEKLRAERKLKLISLEESGSAAEFAPAGVYGFTYSPANEGVPLFNKQSFQIFEVHKLADESVHLIGFMTEEDATTLQSAKGPMELRLYPQPYEKAQRLVSVARDRIVRAKPPSRENGNWIGLIVSAR